MKKITQITLIAAFGILFTTACNTEQAPVLQKTESTIHTTDNVITGEDDDTEGAVIVILSPILTETNGSIVDGAQVVVSDHDFITHGTTSRDHQVELGLPKMGEYDYNIYIDGENVLSDVITVHDEKVTRMDIL